MNIIRIGIVEDDFGWQKILSNFLNAYNDLQVVWIASQKDMAVSLARETEKNTDIILMDLNLSSNERDGINATFDIGKNSNVKIIIISSYNEDKLIRDAFTAGAVNYILKENFREIPNAIRASVNGKSPIENILKEYKALKKENVLRELTQSEREIFNLLENGNTPPKIIKTLHKTESTIKSHINSILKKLDSKSSKQAIEKAKRMGVE